MEADDDEGGGAGDDDEIDSPLMLSTATSVVSLQTFVDKIVMFFKCFPMYESKHSVYVSISVVTDLTLSIGNRFTDISLKLLREDFLLLIKTYSGSL